MLRVQRVDPPQDEAVDYSTHLLLFVHHHLLLPLRRPRFPPSQDVRQRVPSELLLRAQHAGVGEVRHGEELSHGTRESKVRRG